MIAVGLMRTSSKIFIHYDLISLAARLKTMQANVSLKDDAYEKQPECALHTCCTIGVCYVGSDFQDRQL